MNRIAIQLDHDTFNEIGIGGVFALVAREMRKRDEDNERHKAIQIAKMDNFIARTLETLQEAWEQFKTASWTFGEEGEVVIRSFVRAMTRVFLSAKLRLKDNFTSAIEECKEVFATTMEFFESKENEGRYLDVCRMLKSLYDGNADIKGMLDNYDLLK